MQEAIRKFIKDNRGNKGMKLSLEELEKEIDRIKEIEIKRADKEMMAEYDKEMYYRTGIRY